MSAWALGLVAILLRPGTVPPDISHLRLAVAIDDRARSVEGVAEFHYVATGAETDALTLGQRGLRILKVEAQPQALRGYQVEENRLEVRIAGAPAGQKGLLRVHYRAEPRQGLFFHATTTETGTAVQQAWQFQSWEDWMPRPFDPNQRMTWDLEATVRSDWQVVSNGELVGVRPAGSHRVFHWQQPLAVRFEGFTFVAGAFDVFEQRAGRHVLVHYVPAEVADAATVERSFGRLPQMLELFSNQFGAYPFGRFYRQAVVWDYHPGGTEQVGMACLGENKLIDERSRLHADDYIVAHELSHIWWAMLVAARGRAHVWLTEGFAVYFGNQFFEVAEGRDVFEYRLRQRLHLYLEEDRKYQRALVSDEPVPGGLDEHIYSKGAYVLHMLRRWLGDAVFFAGLRRYAERHAYGEADSVDLQRAMEEVSGQQLDWYFGQWLHRKGYPAFRVARRWDERTATLALSIEQTQPDQAGLYRVPVRIQIVTDQGAEVHSELLSERREERAYRVAGKLLYVRFDADNSLLGTVEFPRPVEELRRQWESARDAVGRIEAVEALAPSPGEEAGETLRRALSFDLFHGVRSAAAAALARRGTESVPILLGALRRETDSRVQQSLVGALERFAEREDVQEALRSAAGPQATPPLRARALLALARARASGSFELLLQASGESAHRDVLRAAVFEGLAALGDSRGVPELVRYLESDRTTRWAREPAVEALGRLAGHDPAVRRLLERIRTTDFWPGVREAARQALQ